MPRLAVIFILFLTGFCLLVGPALAATSQGAMGASIIDDIMGNRDRMIQAALVVVALGIALLMWRK